MRKDQLKIGVRSEGTLRIEDLLDAAVDTLAEVAPRRAAGFRREVEKSAKDGHEYGDEILEEISDAVNEHVPQFCYYGSLEGDGACIGVFFSEESMRESVYDGETWIDKCDGKKMPKDARYRAVISDHGNVSIYFRNGREIVSVV